MKSPHPIAIFVTMNFLLWSATFGGAVRDTRNLEYIAGIGFLLAMVSVAVHYRTMRRQTKRTA